MESQTSNQIQHGRVLRLKDVIQKIGLQRASIYRGMAAGTFPRPIALGVRSRGWLETEIDTWVSVRAARREEAK